MDFRNIYDMHTHSKHSFDGNDACKDLCEQAVKIGAMGLAITDHCDIDGADIDSDKLCRAQLSDLDRCKEIFDGKTDLIKGIEIGQGIYRKKQTEKLLRAYDYDFVLGSLHNLENTEDFYFLNFSQYDVYELLTKYFEGLYELSCWGAFDSLAHLTYPIRYIVARDKINVDMSRFDEIIDAIFETLAKNNKALEINTSGLFMPMQDTLPNISYVKRFRELGGKYITIGSDSHYAKKIFQGIDKGCEIALASGFEHITIFKKRQPVLIKIQ